MASVLVRLKDVLDNLESSSRGPWTYGCEFELSDWNRNKALPKGMVIDPQDFTMVNSNGIAVDPTGKTYGFGGEICSAPTETISRQLTQLEAIVRLHKSKLAINYRSNLHIHVRVPGIRTELAKLKQLLAFNLHWLPKVLNYIEPIPIPTAQQYPDSASLAGARRRYRRRLQSHHRIPSSKFVNRQLAARTPKEFFLAGVPHNKQGAAMWGASPRNAVNLNQLLQTDTIEFRHFPGTLSSKELKYCIIWCREWLRSALAISKKTPLENLYIARNFPKFAEYQHDLEVRYRATVHDGTVPLLEIRKYQEQIITGKFKGSPYYA